MANALSGVFGVSANASAIEGTNAPQGRKLLAESGLDLIVATDLTDAARKVVAAAARK